MGEERVKGLSRKVTLENKMEGKNGVS